MADNPGKKPKKVGKVVLGGTVHRWSSRCPRYQEDCRDPKCLEKGELKITLSKVDFAAGKLAILTFTIERYRSKLSSAAIRGRNSS